jgi:hypothetical protein
MTRDQFFYLTSIVQVSRSLVSCVLIGSLAKLLFSFSMQKNVSALQMVDDIISKVISSMVIVLAFKVHCNT